jgi:hypothetical protein
VSDEIPGPGRLSRDILFEVAGLNCSVEVQRD